MEATFVAFDLLRLDGDDLRLRAIEARRDALMRLVTDAKRIVFSEALAAEGAVVFPKACELGLKGIASKRPLSQRKERPIACAVATYSIAHCHSERKSTGSFPELAPKPAK